MKAHVIVAVLLLGLAGPAGADAGDLTKELRQLLAKQKAASISVVISDLHSGQVLASESPRELLKPASVLKILTSATALDTLGPEYRFATELRYDKRSGSKISTLFIKGGADPSLTLESLWLLLRKVYKQGVRSIDSVVIDSAGFSVPRERVGQRAFETGSSPLALSFNSIGLDVCPGALGTGASVIPDPWEADVSVRGSIKTVAKGAGQFGIDERESKSAHVDYTLSGTIGVNRDCETIYRSVRDPVHFFSTVFERMAQSLGISILRVPHVGSTPTTAPLLLTHYSKPLSLIVEDMNHFSTNFIAEQIVYALGYENQAFDRERGLKRLEAQAQTAGFSSGDFEIVDGSGLSHNNRLSAALIAAVLRRAALSPEFGVEFQKSLSVAGRNGTLKERHFDPGVVVRGKTGTLDGVSSLAGLVQAKSGREIAFAILQNGVASKDKAVEFEDALVNAVYQSL